MRLMSKHDAPSLHLLFYVIQLVVLWFSSIHFGKIFVFKRLQ